MTKQKEIQTFEVWSVSHDNMAELATQRQGMGPTDFEQYEPTTEDVFVRYADYERLRVALKDLVRGYVNTLEAGRDRIISLGGDCDSLEVMERGDPYLRKAKEALIR